MRHLRAAGTCGGFAGIAAQRDRLGESVLADEFNALSRTKEHLGGGSFQ